jgi:hypothetical protein
VERLDITAFAVDISNRGAEVRLLVRATPATLAWMLGTALSPSVAVAQQAAPHDVTAIAKTTQNPVGDLVSVPIQSNFGTGGDLEDASTLTVNVQPVIPFRLSEGWHAISRTIVPIESLPLPGGGRSSGVGNIQEQLFLTPSTPGAVTWGIGPTLSLPTATAAAAATGTWAAGIGAVVVTTAGPWVAGALVSQVWPVSDAGNSAETNLLTVQPFVNFNFGSGYAITTAPSIVADWAAAGDTWTIPVGLGISRTAVFNGRPLTLGAQYYYNAVRPDGGAGQLLRFVLSLHYPAANR